jgi:DNA-binding transcriptional LysR family regulator
MAVSLADLEVVLAVEREGSFGRAASALMMTQPAVSERVRHLERVVGRRLFERTTRGAVPTVGGAALVPYARRCLALADQAVEAARQADGSRSLVVAVHSTFAQRVIPLVLAASSSLERRVAIRDVHSEEVTSLLLDGIADVGFALHAGVPRGLVRVELPPDDVVAVARADHPLHAVRRPTPTDLRTCLLAINGWGDGFERFESRLADAGVDDWRVRRCGDAATALTLALAHEHVAFVTRSALSAGGWMDLEPVPLAGMTGWRVNLDLLHRRSDRDDPVLQRLRETVVSP